ncbi:MAG: 50S ribosomal protein L23 [Candidatus Aenigmarchaeota archaeon]|nr:50S ribosomal protein L23 [Candidatus Aenigmarchaeota archaeon]
MPAEAKAPEVKAAEKAEIAKPKAAKKQPEKLARSPDPWKIIAHPHLAEKSVNMIEGQNKLVFMVSRHATKGQVKRAVEKAFEIKVAGVRTVITFSGKKKAYVSLKEGQAADIATRLGMV